MFDQIESSLARIKLQMVRIIKATYGYTLCMCVHVYIHVHVWCIVSSLAVPGFQQGLRDKVLYTLDW